MKYYVYIDDSGDPGLKSTSSSHFIIAAVVVVGEEEKDKLEKALIDYRRCLGWSDKKELKFRKSNKNTVRLAIQAIKEYDYQAYAIIIDKAKLNLNSLQIIERDAIFLYTIKELLIRLRIENAIITIDGTRGPKYVRKARAYLRQQLRGVGLRTERITFEDSQKNSLIQLADLVAGSVARSLSKKEDAMDYIYLFRKKLKKIFRI